MAMIRKAIFPVAGFGSRFLPATKALPKEMLPIVDKPLIQFAVEEAAAAGITQMIFVTGRNKRAIEDYFDKACELETELAVRGKQDLLAQTGQHLQPTLSYAIVHSRKALGVGHAVLCARPLIGDEPFAVILADELIDSTVSVVKQMVDAYERTGCSMAAIQEMPCTRTGRYGAVSIASQLRNPRRVTDIVERPRPDAARPTLGIVGRYILTPAVFDCLRALSPGTFGEIRLTDALRDLLHSEALLAYEFEGTRYDCGSKQGYLHAVVDHAVKYAEIGADFCDHMPITQLPTGSTLTAGAH